MNIPRVTHRVAAGPLQASYYRPRPSDDSFDLYDGWAESTITRAEVEGRRYQVLPDLDGNSWLQAQNADGSPAFRTSLGSDFRLQHLTQSESRIFVASDKELVAIDFDGQVTGKRSLEERATAVVVDHSGRALVATPSTVEVLTPDLVPVHTLDTGFRAQNLRVLDDDSVVAAGRAQGSNGTLKIFAADGELAFEKSGTQASSVKTDGQRVYYLEGFVNGSTYVYDSQKKRSELVSSSIRGSGLHPLGGGDYMAYHHDNMTTLKHIEVHRADGKDVKFRLSLSEDVKGGFSNQAGEFYAFTRYNDSYRLSRLPLPDSQEEQRASSSAATMWMINPWMAAATSMMTAGSQMMGQSPEQVYTADDYFTPAVFQEGGFAILSRDGAFLSHAGEEKKFDSVQQLVDEYPELLSKQVSGELFGQQSRWLDQTFAERLDYWAAMGRTELTLPVVAETGQVVNEAPKVVVTPSLFPAEPPELKGLNKREVAFCERLERQGQSHHLVGTYDGHVYWVTPEATHGFSMQGEQPVGAQVDGERVLVAGSQGGVLEINTGENLRFDSLKRTEFEHIEDGFVVGDFEVEFR